MTETTTPGGDVERADPTQRRAWWRTLPAIVLIGMVPVAFGLYFLGILAIALLLSDRTRDDEVRAGGSALLLWWMYSFRQGYPTPWVSAAMLGIALVFFARSALRRRAEGHAARAWLHAAVALAAVAAIVAAFVPWGLAEPKLSRADALERALHERSVRPWHGISADLYLIERGRLRFVHKPVYFVVFYERNTDVDRTADNQPCLRRREVWRVDALDGGVARETHDDAKVADDPCLPLRVGTERDLLPVPAA